MIVVVLPVAQEINKELHFFRVLQTFNLSKEKIQKKKKKNQKD